MIGSPDLKMALIKKQRQLEDDLDQDIKAMSNDLLSKVKETFTFKRKEEDPSKSKNSQNSALRQRKNASKSQADDNQNGQLNPAFETEMDNFARSEITDNKINLQDPSKSTIRENETENVNETSMV